MIDTYEYLMTREPEYEFSDRHISFPSAENINVFSERDGAFRKSFDISFDHPSKEARVLSATARFQTSNGSIPTLQIRLINECGKTLYYSPVYQIGETREFYRKEWRIPPAVGYFNKIRISFFIPDGVSLFIREFHLKDGGRIRTNDFGIRYHAHSGFPCYAPSNTAFSFQMAAEMGFTSCITIPKFTKDKVGICFHDDATVRKRMRYPDGSFIAEGSLEDKPAWEYTYEELCALDAGLIRDPVYAGIKVPTLEEYFRICSMTGMSPIFSVHPALTREEWLEVRRLLEKYRLLSKFWIKSGSPKTQKIAIDVFDDQIAGYIMIQGLNKHWDPLEQSKRCGFDLNRHRVVTEFFYCNTTEEKIIKAREEGFTVSIATSRGGISGPCMKKLIDLGVSEFTIDHHCSMGLDW